MTLERYFNLSSYALLAASTALLAATRQLDAITLTLFGAALLLACVIDSGVGRWWAPRRWMNWLLIGGLLAAVAAWYFFDAALPPLTMRFLLFTVALRLLRQKHERDWRWLYTVSFLQVLFSAGLLLGTTFLALLIVYLFAALSTLVSFELRRAQHSFDEHRHSELNLTEYWREARTRRTRPPFKTPLKAPRWRNVALFAGAALVLIFVLAAPLFMAMPRLGRVLPSNFLRGAALSGFTESVRLGEVARIKLNPQVVMRVRVKSPPQAPRQWLRWRGLALDHYEDGNWSRFMPPPKHGHGEIADNRRLAGWPAEDRRKLRVTGILPHICATNHLRASKHVVKERGVTP